MLYKLTVLLLLSQLVCGAPDSNENNDIKVIEIPVYKGQGKNEIVRIEMQIAEFIPNHHVIVESDDEFSVAVDGKPVIGIDGVKDMNRTGMKHLKKMSVTWKGKIHEIKPNLYDTVFNFALHRRTLNNKSIESGFNICESKDGSMLLIRMTSDLCASCGYTVYWIIDANGKQSRFIELLPF